MNTLTETIRRIPIQNQQARAAATAELEAKTMPHWALGQLLDLAVDLAGMTGTVPPTIKQKTVVVMAGDHGVCAEGVSKYPSEVTAQMVANFANGGAAINVLSKQAQADVVIVDMGVQGDLSALHETGQVRNLQIAPGTQNMSQGPAMSREQALAAVTAGIALACDLATTTDVFATGDMGIGNTTASTAICAVLTGSPVNEITGMGTGIDATTIQHKAAVIEKAIACNQPDPTDGLDVLAKVGGFEIGGLAGLILGAASNGKPVIIDGFISTAAALIAAQLCPLSTGYMIAAHGSAEPGHQHMLKHLNKTPLLNLGLRLGEGTGAALAMPLLDAAIAILTDMATFEQAAVSGSSQ